MSGTEFISCAIDEPFVVQLQQILDLSKVSSVALLILLQTDKVALFFI